MKTDCIGSAQIQEALSRLVSWLQTWKTKNGGYNGFVVHRGNLKRMYKIHDTPWSQGPIINGYINLYRKTGDGKWLAEAIQAAHLQTTRLHNSGKYIYAGFEDDRFSSLVHNSLANCSLLDLAGEFIEQGDTRSAEKYISTVEHNTREYIIGRLWVESYGAFKFSEIDHYWPQEDRFVANMNSVAVENLIKLNELTGDSSFLSYAYRVGEWLLTQQIISDDITNGGISYAQTHPRVVVSIYTALSMRGLDDLWHLTRDERYKVMMATAARHLMNFRDPETKLFYHAVYNGELRKYPLFLAGAGIILKALDNIRNLFLEDLDLYASLETLLLKQLPNGGFPTFIGCNTPDNWRPKGDNSQVWEDIVPCVGWNSHLFEFLTRWVSQPCELKSAEVLAVSHCAPKFVYYEGKKYVLILGLRPPRSIGVFLIRKVFSLSIICFHLSGLIKLSIRVIKKLTGRWNT